VQVEKVFLFLFHRKPRPSGVTLESPGVENMLEVPGDPAEVGQNQHAPQAVLATLLV